MRVYANNISGLGDVVPTAPLYPIHDNSVTETARRLGLTGLGSCYAWTQPCEPYPEGTCGRSTTANAAGPSCPPTATWFWITAGVAGAAALLFGGRRR